MADTITFEQFRQQLPKAVAIRRVARLQPAGGVGDKVFPPTYEGGQYALEDRVVDGVRKPCVILDSVQSQANRMELALLAAHRAGETAIPLVEVDFDKAEIAEVGSITSLEAPHRLADAILRDSMNGGVKFRDSVEGKILDTATLASATGLFGLSPTSLVFGLWDSAGPRGGLGTKFQRAIVSELVGVDIETGVRPSSRLDPLGIQLNAGPVYESVNGGWTREEGQAKKDQSGKAIKIGKEGKPSEINHGNVMPSIKGNHGGVTLAYALQTTVISLPALRRLHFPVADKGKPAQAVVDAAAHVALAALGLCGAVLSVEQGCDLRSRCLLVPEAGSPPAWEWVLADGSVQSFVLDGDDACKLLNSAVVDAVKAGLVWRKDPLVLTPSEGLVALVKRSRELAMHTAVED